jgi:hypothetical protein
MVHMLVVGIRVGNKGWYVIRSGRAFDSWQVAESPGKII